MYKINNKLTSLIIFLSVLFLYYAFSEAPGVYSSYDSASFAIATMDYDLKQNLPHMPGYFLHIKLINLAKVLTGTTHSAMLWLNLIYSALGAVFAFLIFRRFLDNINSILLTAVIMTNPMTWYYGCSLGVYPFDLFYSGVIIWCGLNKRLIYLAPIILTLGAGVRQSSGFLMFLPVIFFFVRALNKKELRLIPTITAIVLSIAGFLVWALPMIENAGGLANYIHLFQANSPLSLRHAFIKNFANAVTYGLYIFIPAIIIILFSVVNRKKPCSMYKSLVSEKSSLIIKLFFVWPLPILIFFLLFVYSKGYYLLNIVGLYFIAVVFLRHFVTKRFVIIILILSQMVSFLFMPYDNSNLQVNFAPSKRAVGKVEVWKDRLNNVFMLSQKAIRSRENQASQISQCLQNIRKSKEFSKKVIFIAPSSQMKARILQAVYPELEFAFMNVYENDSYFLLYSTKFQTLYGLEHILSKSIIITSRTFYNKYLSEKIANSIYKTKDFVVYDPTGDINTIMEIYNKYYLRAD